MINPGILASVKNLSNIFKIGNITKLDGDIYTFTIWPCANPGLYDPHAWYDNGRTYMAIRKQFNIDDGRAGVIGEYNGNVSVQYMPTAPSIINYHDEPTIFSDGQGNFTLIHEQHNQDLHDYFQNTIPYDITSFESKGKTANIGDYPKTFRRANGTFFQIAREWPIVGSVRGLDLIEFDGTSWGSKITLMRPDTDPVGTVLTYPYLLINGGGSGDIHSIIFKKRVGFNPEDINYKFSYYLECDDSDIYTWYNKQRTFSKNIQISGNLTETELNANCRFADDSEIGTGGRGMIYNGKIYFNHSIDSQQRVDIYDNGWNFKSISTTKNYLYAPYSNKIITVGQSDDFSDIIKSETTDFNTISELGTILSDNESVGGTRMVLPQNFHEIPIGGKFAMFAQNRKTGTDTVNGTISNDVYVIEVTK